METKTINFEAKPVNKEVKVKTNPKELNFDEKEEKNKERKIVYKCIKRIADIVFSIIGTIGILPIALIVKITYVLSGDYKTIFYKQKRIGRFGKTIYIYKFRTMVYNADELLKELLKEQEYQEQWNKYQKIENDPRITKVGKILRKTSLDEFPQFLNVLKGDMSLIGPRPLIEGELDKHNGNHELYESVKPRDFKLVGC